MKLDINTALLGVCAVGIGICAVEMIRTNRIMAIVASTQDDIGEMADSHFRTIEESINTLIGE